MHSEMRKLGLLLLSNTMIVNRMVRKLVVVLLLLLLLIINGRLMVSKLMVHGVFVFDIVNSCNISSGSFFTRYVRIFVGHVHHSDKSLIHIYRLVSVKKMETKKNFLLLMLSGLCEIIFLFFSVVDKNLVSRKGICVGLLNTLIVTI